MSLSLVDTIYDTNYRQIADMLREMADKVEEAGGDNAYLRIGLVAERENEYEYYGWGDVTIRDAYFLFSKGAAFTMGLGDG